MYDDNTRQESGSPDFYGKMPRWFSVAYAKLCHARGVDVDWQAGRIWLDHALDRDQAEVCEVLDELALLPTQFHIALPDFVKALGPKTTADKCEYCNPVGLVEVGTTRRVDYRDTNRQPRTRFEPTITEYLCNCPAGRAFYAMLDEHRRDPNRKSAGGVRTPGSQTASGNFVEHRIMPAPDYIIAARRLCGPYATQRLVELEPSLTEQPDYTTTTPPDLADAEEAFGRYAFGIASHALAATTKTTKRCPSVTYRNTTLPAITATYYQALDAFKAASLADDHATIADLVEQGEAAVLAATRPAGATDDSDLDREPVDLDDDLPF